MIIGSHLLLYSSHPEQDRAFFRDVLNFPTVSLGHGWLIFGLPPAEMGVHPVEQNVGREQAHGGHRLLGAVLYLICDDLAATIASLQGKGVSCTQIAEEEWGIHTSVVLPSGSGIGLYQPKHELAIKAQLPNSPA